MPSSLISMVSAVPLLKAPLLLLVGVVNYAAFSPPNTSASKGTQKLVEKADFITRVLKYWAMTAKLTLVIIYILAGLEATVILSQSYPSALSTRILTLFIPSHTGKPTYLDLDISPWCFAGFVLAFAGGAFRYWAIRTLGRFFVMEVSLQKGHKLATSGPYALVRHPSYTGYIPLVVGDVLIFLSSGSYLAQIGAWDSPFGWLAACILAGRSVFVAVVLMPVRAGKEDAVLREEFGREWEAWAEKTPYKLIPYVF